MSSTSLATISKAAAALVKAKTLDDVLHIRDQAEALRTYIKAAAEGIVAANAAAEIKLRAERKAGEMLAAMEKKKPGPKPKPGPEQEEIGPTMGPISSLDDLGITKNQSSRWQQEASVPEEKFTEFLEDCRDNQKEVTQAGLLRIANQAKPVAGESKPLPSGKYRVIYADPPWQYGDQRTNTTQSGSASSQYPTMPIADICDMPVEDLAAKDSVLFLWATAPLLVEAVDVIEAWGFKYKAQFIWDKVRGYNGHYNDVRHELLLIATKGSCVPKVDKLTPSIIAEPKSKHSKKPERFYELIEHLYPISGNSHIELFSRKARDKWTAWGNQVDA